MSKYLKFTGDSLRQQFEDNYKFEFYGDNYVIVTDIKNPNFIKYISISELKYIMIAEVQIPQKDNDEFINATIVFNDDTTLDIIDIWDYEFNDTYFTIRNHKGEEYQLPSVTHKSILFNKYKIKGGFFCLI
jgi:hypothetical protein